LKEVKMQINIYKDYDEMSREAAEFIIRFVRTKPDALLCFPAGESPAGTFKYLVQASYEGKVDFSRCRFVGLDEWVGFDENDKGSCKYFMYKNLFEPLSIKQSNIVFFDACSKDLKTECTRVDGFIALNGPIDLMLVGVGMNGHIALNEPGISFDLYSHVVDLDPVTMTVAQKYFDQETKLEKGISLGLRHLNEAGTAVLIANGRKKAGILKNALIGKVSNQVPASILQLHKNSFIFLDKDAAAELTV
jgi:glucosamine-6-phosphate isomerase